MIETRRLKNVVIFDSITMRNIFLQKDVENEAKGVVPHLFLFFKRDLSEVKASGLRLTFNIF